MASCGTLSITALGASKRSSFTADADRHEFSFRFIELPSFSGSNPGDSSSDDELFISPRDYGRRQAYLRSYTFTRAEAEGLAVAPAADRNQAVNSKGSRALVRLKAAVWAMVACTGKWRVPVGAVRVLKERVVVRARESVSDGVRCYLQTPKCLMAGAC